MRRVSHVKRGKIEFPFIDHGKWEMDGIGDRVPGIFFHLEGVACLMMGILGFVPN